MSAPGMSGAIERVRAAAQKRADLLRGQVRARIAAALPGVAVAEEGDRIVLTGRGLVRRWVAQGDLRDLREGQS